MPTVTIAMIVNCLLPRLLLKYVLIGFFIVTVSAQDSYLQRINQVLADPESAFDPRLPDFTPTKPPLEGTWSSVGNAALNNLITLWAEVAGQHHPNLNFQIEGNGSSTARGALLYKEADAGPDTRLWKPAERELFRKKFGYDVTEVRVAIDIHGVYVHKDNPIAKSGLTLPQLDAIFSSTRKLGHPDDITRWGDLGLTGEWANRPITLYGRHPASGTSTFFKEVSLGGGDFKDTVLTQPGSTALIKHIGEDLGGIGYSGIGYMTKDVAVVPLAPTSNVEPIAPVAANIEMYPLARYLYIAVNKAPDKPLSPAVREMFRVIYSRQGAAVSVMDGFPPLGADVAAEEAKKLGIPFTPRDQ